MEKMTPSSTETVLRDWRITILNNFLIIVAIISIPALGTILLRAFSASDMLPLAVQFTIVETILIMITVIRKIPYRIRVYVLLLLGYAASVINLQSNGLRGAGPLYLVVIPVISVILLGKRTGILSAVVSAGLASATAVLLGLNILIPSDLPTTPWISLTSTLMLLTVCVALLVLFYSFQERVIAGERKAQGELLQAHQLLEEQNLDLEQKVKARTEEFQKSIKIQTALYEIADSANTSRNIDEFYAHIHEIIGTLMYARNFFIALYDENTGLLSFPYFVDEKDEDFIAQPLVENHGLTGYMIRTGKAIRHGNELFSQLLSTHEVELVGSMNEDGIGAPLKVHGKTIGAIFVQSYTEGIHYTDQDEEILAYAAQQIATALTRYRAVESERQRGNELAILYSVAGAMGKTLDLRSITRLVGDKILEVFQVDAVMIYLLDEQTNMLHSYYEYDAEEGGYIDYVEPFPLGTGLSSKVIRTQKSLMLGTLEEEIANGAYFPPEILEKSRGNLSPSWLRAPIIVNERAVGLVSLADSKEHAFNDGQRRMLETLSSNMGVAIANAQLFQSAQQRAAELTAINTVSSALVSELDLDVLIKLAGEQTREVFQADIAYVALLDESGSQIHFPYAYGEDLTPIQFGEGVTSKVIQSNTPLLINEEVEKHVQEMGATEVGQRSLSYLGVPIIVSGKAVGVLSVQSTHKEGVFHEDDLRLLTTIAANVSTAIQNARLFDEIRSQKTFYEALIQTSPAAIVILDNQNMVTSWNPAAERVFGYTPSEAAGKFIIDLVSDAGSRPEAIAFSNQVIEGKAVHSFVQRCRKDGSELDLELFAVPVFFEEKRAGTFAIYHDITELKHAQAAIQESQRQLADIIDFLPDATLVIDRSGKVIAWNRAIEEMTGIKAEEILKKGNYEYALPFYGERRPILIDLVLTPREEFEKEQYAKIKREGETLTGETFTPNLWSGARYLFATATPLHDSAGKIVGAIETIRDITDRKLAEEELQKAKAAAEQANQAKSAFLANMSHELRTPLNAITGFTRIVRRKSEGILPEKQIENLDKVLSSSDHLLNLINTVLDIAKIEAGRMDVLAANFRIGALIDLCYNTAQPLIRPGVVLEKQVDETLSTIYSDQDKIRQVILNLLSNAAKFTHEGKIVISVTRDEERNLHIAVSDTGIGISDEAITRIFSEFQQADNTTTRQYGGTGLGLTISRNLAHLLGGDLIVTSELGKGSTFTLVIPMEFKPKAPPVEEYPEEVLSAAMPVDTAEPTPAISRNEARRRVLVIDDDPDAVYLLQENLNPEEFEISGTRNGRTGLRMAKENPPDAILLDIIMPGADGWQILHDLKEDPATADIPVILLTIVDKKALGFKLGASAYLLKPLDPAAVREALDRVTLPAGKIPKHVLVVDDDPNIADMLRQFLTEPDYQLESALNGELGLQAVHRNRPDILLLDIIMPVLDGFGVIEALRADPETCQLPVIVISAKELSADESRRLKESVTLVVKKQGLDGEHLEAEINAILHC